MLCKEQSDSFMNIEFTTLLSLFNEIFLSRCQGGKAHEIFTGSEQKATLFLALTPLQ